MPSAPLRFCSTPFCSNKVTSGKCAEHEQQRRTQQRFTLDKRYGTQRWRRYSRSRLTRHPFCHWCGKLAEVTDHVVPVAEAPERFFDESNHVSACGDCNRRRAGAFGHRVPDGGRVT